MTARVTRLGVLALAVLLPLVAGAQALHNHEHDPVGGSFIITTAPNGDMLCRQATASEVAALRSGDVPLTVFGEGRSRIKANADSAGLNIVLLGTDQLNASPDAKAAFEKAAELWESRIANPITIYVKVDYGTKRFGTDYPSANILGSTGSASWIFDEGGYAEIREEIISRADNVSETALYNLLPENVLPTDSGPITRFGAGSALLRALNVLPPKPEDDPADYAGRTTPEIGFNSAFPFDFDPTDGITTGRTDFVGVAVHEMGHMLGFSSRTGTGEISETAIVGPSILDLFRFRPGVNMDTFGSAERVLKTGGDQVWYAGGKELALSTGNPRGENGDGQQASHWKDDGQSGVHIGVMDPTIPRARRVEITKSDIEAFSILGWDMVSPGCTELESNDSFEDASEAPFNTPCSGTTGSTGEGLTLVKTVKLPSGANAFVQDLFKVTLPGSAKLNVSMSFTTAAADLNLLLLRGDDSLIASSAGSGTTETLESGTLDAGTYYIGISSALGTSPYTVSVTPIGLKPPRPNAPTSLLATPSGSASIRLNWLDNSANEEDFRIERFDGANWNEIAVIGSNTTTYNVTGLAADSTYVFRVRARNEGGDSAYTTEASAKTLFATGACVSSDTTVCLVDGRFRVAIDFLNQFANPPQPGRMLGAKLLPGPQITDTATFGFGNAQNIEVVVRIGDTRPFGLNRFDVYYGGMTDIEYTVTVQDMQTGTTRLYRNAPGNVGAGVDRTSFPSDGSVSPIYAFANASPVARTPIVMTPVTPRTCVPGANKVCLVDGRFEVQIDFLNQFANPPAPGQMLGAKLLPGSQNPDTAIFGFGSAQAIEAVVRLQDVRPFGVNRFDVYVGGMSDIEYRVTVTDTVTGSQRQYHNPAGAVGGVVDRTSFALTN
ncbi:MAG TPA: NF038122 family metalloprotease [Thermoanaerobaculia bacterium]|nr:NF038122 family metalloprotease [Thermoanaerobaculia bacterium]